MNSSAGDAKPLGTSPALDYQSNVEAKFKVVLCNLVKDLAKKVFSNYSRGGLTTVKTHKGLLKTILAWQRNEMVSKLSKKNISQGMRE